MAKSVEINSTYRFTPDASAGTVASESGVTKDGLTWDLTGATVTLILKSPTGGVTTLAATITDAANGKVECVIGVGVITVAGQWSRAWRFQQGSIDITTAPVLFTALASP